MRRLPHVTCHPLHSIRTRSALNLRWLVLLSFLLPTPSLTEPLAPLPPPTASDQKKTKLIAVRWAEDQPGCTFSSDDDGKYRYGLWSDDIGLILAVDAREVQVIRHRIEPVFGVSLTVRYRGSASLDIKPEDFSLQFMKHFKVVQPALDPDSYNDKIQSDADTFDDETRRDIEKHPDQKQALEARLQNYQRSVNELIEFFSHRSLRAAHLDPAHPEAGGWVFFNTDNRWLGKWKSQEEFILRVPIGGQVYEFPFKLPPKKGELLLQKRE
jgi:hypothetical protein